MTQPAGPARARAATTQATSPRSISTNQLAYLAAISRHATWADAAAELHVSPSALSQGIAELERRLGIELFSWEGRRRVRLAHTDEVVRYAERVLAETADIQRWLRAVSGGGVGRLRIGMIDAAAVHHFPVQLRAFRSSRPDLEVHLSVAPTGELLDELSRGGLDVAVCVDPAGQGQFDSVAVTREDLAVYAPTSELAKAPPSAWGPWVLFPPSSRTRQAIERQLRSIGAPLDIEMESHQPEVLCEMVRSGMGWSVLPVVQAERGPDPLIRAWDEPLLRRTISVVTRRSTPLHPAAAELISLLTGA